MGGPSFKKKYIALFLLLNWKCTFIQCQNENSEENVLAKIYGTFYSIVKLSNNFRQFPMQDDFRRNISSPEDQTMIFHQRLSKLLELYGISKDCRRDMLQLNIALKNGEDWARRMIDAAGKPGSRLIDQRFRWIGNFDECTKIKSSTRRLPLNTTHEDLSMSVAVDHVVRGQYFSTFIRTPSELRSNSSMYIMKTFKSTSLLLRIDFCLPASCSSTDVNLVVQVVAGQIEKRTSPVPSKTFSQEYIELTTAGYVVIGILCFLAVLLVIGTGYDIFVVRLKLFCQTNKLQITPLNYVETDTKSHIANKDTVENHQQPNEAALEHEVKEMESLLNRTDQETSKAMNDGVCHETRETNEQRPDKMHAFFMAFSVVRHGEEILTVKESKNRIDAIEGMRALTLFWVVLIHSVIYSSSSSGNFDLWYSTKYGNLLYLMTFVLYVVDTFFAMSGFLVTYLSLKRMQKDGGARRFPWVKYYLLRFWRLTPTFYLVFFVFWKVYPSLSSGPFWINPEKSSSLLHTCDKMWWKTLLFVNNFYDDVKKCYPITWYISADTQLYFISPLFLILLFHFPKLGLAVASFFLVACSVIFGVITKVFKFIPARNVATTNDKFMLFNHYYTFAHVSSWMIGMILGYLMFTRRNTIKVSKLVNIAGWCMAGGIVAFIVFIPAVSKPGELHYNDYTAAYLTLSRPLWTCAVAWVIFSCGTGNGGFINSVLSWKPFIVLGRLTFATYLVHLMVVLFCHQNKMTPIYISDINMLYESAGTTTLSYVCGFIISVCVERPMFALKDNILNDKL